LEEEGIGIISVGF